MSTGLMPDAALSDAAQTVKALLEAVDIADLAAHNAGYLSYDADRFASFVEAEMGRFARALSMVTTYALGRRVVDLGTFIPVLPVALAKLGYDVTIVERFSLYGPSFTSALTVLAEKTGLHIVDLDLSTDALTDLGQFDVVLLMAVLEHLNGSPVDLMRRIRSSLGSQGRLVLDVPNIAELSQRLRLLAGRSPLPDYGQYLRSAYPFSGHNREMTAREVRMLLNETGFAVRRLEVYDYIPNSALTAKGRLLRRLKAVLPGDVGEVITALATPAGAP